MPDEIKILKKVNIIIILDELMKRRAIRKLAAATSL